MLINYFTSSFGIVHLLRFVCFLILLICIEIRFPSCSSSLNEYLGLNQTSILFYYILIWISFAFEIFFLVHRLLGTIEFQAKRSVLILHVLLAIGFVCAASFTLHAFLHQSDGHVITQHDDLNNRLTVVLPVSIECNRLRLIGVVQGFLLTFLYLLSTFFICRSNLNFIEERK